MIQLPSTTVLLQTVWILPGPGVSPFQAYCGDVGLTLAMLIKWVGIGFMLVYRHLMMRPADGPYLQRRLFDISLPSERLDRGLGQQPSNRPGPGPSRFLRCSRDRGDLSDVQYSPRRDCPPDNDWPRFNWRLLWHRHGVPYRCGCRQLYVAPNALLAAADRLSNGAERPPSVVVVR